MKINIAVEIKKIASAILVFNLYNWVTTIALIPIGQRPIKVITEISNLSSVNIVAMMKANTGMIMKRTGNIARAIYL